MFRLISQSLAFYNLNFHKSHFTRFFANYLVKFINYLVVFSAIFIVNSATFLPVSYLPNSTNSSNISLSSLETQDQKYGINPKHSIFQQKLLQKNQGNPHKLAIPTLANFRGQILKLKIDPANPSKNQTKFQTNSQNINLQNQKLENLQNQTLNQNNWQNNTVNNSQNQIYSEQNLYFEIEKNSTNLGKNSDKSLTENSTEDLTKNVQIPIQKFPIGKLFLLQNTNEIDNQETENTNLENPQSLENVTQKLDKNLQQKNENNDEKTFYTQNSQNLENLENQKVTVLSQNMGGENSFKDKNDGEIAKNWQTWQQSIEPIWDKIDSQNPDLLFLSAISLNSNDEKLPQNLINRGYNFAFVSMINQKTISFGNLIAFKNLAKLDKNATFNNLTDNSKTENRQNYLQNIENPKIQKALKNSTIQNQKIQNSNSKLAQNVENLSENIEKKSEKEVIKDLQINQTRNQQKIWKNNKKTSEKQINLEVLARVPPEGLSMGKDADVEKLLSENRAMIYVNPILKVTFDDKMTQNLDTNSQLQNFKNSQNSIQKSGQNCDQNSQNSDENNSVNHYQLAQKFALKNTLRPNGDALEKETLEANGNSNIEDLNQAKSIENMENLTQLSIKNEENQEKISEFYLGVQYTNYFSSLGIRKANFEQILNFINTQKSKKISPEKMSNIEENKRKIQSQNKLENSIKSGKSEEIFQNKAQNTIQRKSPNFLFSGDFNSSGVDNRFLTSFWQQLWTFGTNPFGDETEKNELEKLTNFYNSQSQNLQNSTQNNSQNSNSQKDKSDISKTNYSSNSSDNSTNNSNNSNNSQKVEENFQKNKNTKIQFYRNNLPFRGFGWQEIPLLILDLQLDGTLSNLSITKKADYLDGFDHPFSLVSF